MTRTPKVGERVIYRGTLAPYVGAAGIVLAQWKTGLCKGRVQVHFNEPVREDGVEIDPCLTVHPRDLEEAQ